MLLCLFLARYFPSPYFCCLFPSASIYISLSPQHGPSSPLNTLFTIIGVEGPIGLNISHYSPHRRICVTLNRGGTPVVDAGYPAQMSAQLHSLPPAAANLRPRAGLHTRQTLHCLFKKILGENLFGFQPIELHCYYIQMVCIVDNGNYYVYVCLLLIVFFASPWEVKMKV